MPYPYSTEWLFAAARRSCPESLVSKKTWSREVKAESQAVDMYHGQEINMHIYPVRVCMYVSIPCRDAKHHEKSSGGYRLFSLPHNPRNPQSPQPTRNPLPARPRMSDVLRVYGSMYSFSTEVLYST